MKISELNTKINILTKYVQDGPVEELDGHYTPFITSIWAKKVRLLGQEHIKYGLEHNRVQVNFIIRSRKDITEDMYIEHDNVIYNIIGFEALEDNSNYMLIATVRK